MARSASCPTAARRDDAHTHRFRPVPVRQRGAGQRSRPRTQRQLLGRKAASCAGSLRRGARRHHPRPRIAQRQRRHRHQCAHLRHGARARKEPNLTVERAPGNRPRLSGLQLARPILNDVRVRQAIAYAIDRAPMIRIPLARLRATRLQHSSPQSWAYNGRRADLRPTIPTRRARFSTPPAIQRSMAFASTSR